MTVDAWLRGNEERNLNYLAWRQLQSAQSAQQVNYSDQFPGVVPTTSLNLRMNADALA